MSNKLQKFTSDTVRRKALELGADQVGIAPAAVFEEPGGPAAYQRWVERGMHGAMGYMARDPASRLSILRWFPEAKSVIMLAFGYSSPPVPAEQAGHAGRVARYALSEDYHPILKAKTEALLAWLQSERPDTAGKPFVDTSPVLERLYARHAGLGWVGKNSMLVSPRQGSFFFLAGLAVDAELEPDAPIPDHCGECRRCLEACPTSAFPEPRVLDASRCVAYLTIEHRGPVPEELRPGVGDRVFGCDVCQEACPFNRFAAANPLFPSRLPGLLPLLELADMEEAEFVSRLGPTPLERARRRGLIRNALLAMGNSGDRRFVPALERFARNADETLAEQARWSLSRLQT